MSAKDLTAVVRLFDLLESRYAMRVLWALRDGHPQTSACCKTASAASPPTPSTPGSRSCVPPG